MKKWIFLSLMAAVMPLTLLAQSNPSQMIEQAKQEGKYLFVFLYKDAVPASKKMETVFDEALRTIGEKGLSIKIDTQNKSNQFFIDQFDLSCAPIPFVLVLAPNGAITGGFPSSFSEIDLLNAFASPAMEQTLKALQERKMVFLAIQNAKTAHNKEALSGVNDFKSDPRFSKATALVMLDPSDEREAKFIKQLQVDPHMREATTIFLAPPGQTVGKFVGPTTNEQLTKALEKAVSGCCEPGCCPGGCCP